MTPRMLPHDDKGSFMNFSKDLPEGCPLPAAQACSTTIYMISPENPVSDQSCLSQAERGKAKKATGDGACTRHGLSVFPNFESCRHQRSLFPRIGSFIAAAKLGPEHGRIMSTPSGSNPSHMTWWPYEETNRSELFTIIGEE